MKRISKCFVLMLLAMMAMPEMIFATDFFKDTDGGDVNIGFRKTGSHAEQVEMVFYAGNIGDFLLLAPGAVTNLNGNLQTTLAKACPDNLAFLQWSAFSSFESSFYPSGFTVPGTNWNFHGNTCWFTVPRITATVQTTPPNRSGNEGDLSSHIYSTADNAFKISSTLATTNSTNYVLVVNESIAQFAPSSEILSSTIGDAQNSALGDFGGDVFNFSMENTTPSSFSTAQVCDFYQAVPQASGLSSPITDPITGLKTGACYYVGFFTLNPNGSMTFTRASLAAVPVPGTITSSATNGFSPLSVIFTNSATGSITNWVWNFGDGTIITNSTGANVTHSYSTTGTFTVILTVEGQGGASSVTNTAFIATSSTPKLKFLVSGQKFIIRGTNCPINVQYRILGATNMPGTWITLTTSTFLSDSTFNYTNMTTNAASYFKLASP